MTLFRAIIDKFLCCHDWKELWSVTVDRGFGDISEVKYFTCKKCGKIKKLVYKNI